MKFWCVDLLGKRFFRPCGNHGSSPFFLLNALTQFQCIEILSGAWLLWLALLCQSSHLHRHFKSVCGAASLRANSCVPSPPLWPYRGQDPDSGWNLTHLVAATLRGGEGRIEVICLSPCICSSHSKLLVEAVQNYLTIVKLLNEFVFHTATASLPGKAVMWFSVTILCLSNECYFISSVL